MLLHSFQFFANQLTCSLLFLFLQILKPAFTILVDHKTKSFLLLIRGTHSIKDTLTAATGAVVPFHHSVVHEGGVSNLVLGYAHGGMVAAARWIAKLAIPSLTKGLEKYPDYKLKVLTLDLLFYMKLSMLKMRTCVEVSLIYFCNMLTGRFFNAEKMIDQ